MPTPGCSGGNGVINTGVQSTVVYAGGGAALLALVPGLEWLDVVAIALGLLAFDLTQICPAGPPALSNFTVPEALALITLTLGTPDFNSGLAKLQAIYDNIVWAQFCHCDNSFVPTPPTYPPQPAIGFYPQYSGNALRITTTPTNTKASSTATGAVTSPTYDDSAWTSIIAAQGTGSGSFTAFACDGSSSFTGGTYNVPRNDVYLITDSTTTASTTDVQQIRWQFDLPFIPQGTPILQLFFPFGSGTVSGNESVNGSATAPVFNCGNWTTELGNLVIGRNVIYIGAICTWNGAQRAIGASITWPGGGTGPIPNDCCEATQQKLNQLVSLLTLVQRQAAPFAYIASTLHSGLTGVGAISVQGLLGAKITPASIPPGAGVAHGDPDTLWLDSWINWGNADGWTAREFLRSSPYISLPPLAGQFTQIGYSLSGSLSVDIQELKREP